MIANTLILPAEFPPHISDVKRALLTYDRVYLYSPDDRDLMPSEMYNAAAFGMPIGFTGVPVRPLGKVSGYDDAFQELLEECKPAIEQQSIEVLPSAAKPVDPTMKSAGLMIGSPAPPANQVNPAFLLQHFRGLAANSRIVTGVGRGLDALPPLSEENRERLAPPGMDDQQWTFQIVGVTPQLALPSPALYDGFAHTDEERLAYTRICLARLAALVRALGHCELLGLQPFTADTGYASVIQQLSANAREVVEEATEGVEQDEAAVGARLLSRLHNLVMAEFVDARVLNAMSVHEILKLRSKAWGEAGENREALLRQLREFSLTAKTPAAFDQACSRALEEHRRARANWENEAAQLRVRLLADLGKVVIGSATGNLGAELAQKAVSLGSFEGLLLVGGIMFMIAAGQRGPEVLKILHQLKERDRLPGCGLARPYQPFLAH